MPHLHLQVQTHLDLWDLDNRSVPFAFEPDGRVLARNDRVGASRIGLQQTEQSRDNVPSLQGYRGLSDASERVGGTES